MLVLLVVCGTAVYALVKYLSIERIGDLGVDSAAPNEPRNYLIVGSDKRDPDGPMGPEDAEDIQGQRSDSLMVVRVDPAESEAATLSIPRDLVVPISGTGDEDRINSAYSIDRATLLDTIRDSLGIDVHHFVEVDFSAFETLVDALGGVDIWLDQAIKDERSGLYVDELGCVTVDGEQALAFVRARQLQYVTSSGGWSKPDPTADLGRIERQQVFVSQAISDALSQVKSNPARIPDLVDVGVGAVAVDDQMSVRDLIAMAEAMGDLDPDALESHELPVVERGDGATLAIDEEEAESVLKHFRADTEDERTSNGGSTGSGQSTTTTVPEPSEFLLGEPPEGETC